MVRQCGITHVVGGMNFRPGWEKADREYLPWSYTSLLLVKTAYEDAGFTFDVLESRPPMNKIKLALPGREPGNRVRDRLNPQPGQAGRASVVLRMDAGIQLDAHFHHSPARGSALATAYDHELMKNAPLTEYGIVTEDQLWENLKYLLEIIIPVAEEANVKFSYAPGRSSTLADPRAGQDHAFRG